MRVLVITANAKIHIVEIGEPFEQSLQILVEGFWEIVRPQGLHKPYVMIVNKSGRIQQLPINLIGSALYGTPQHGQPIAGTVVIMKETPNELTGLTEDEAKETKMFLDIMWAIAGKKGKKGNGQ